MKREISDTILETINYIVQQNVKQLMGNYARSVIKDYHPDTQKYRVTVNGADYDVVCGIGVPLKRGDAVLIHIPDNNYTKAYICALIKSCNGGNGDNKVVTEGDMTAYVKKAEMNVVANLAIREAVAEAYDDVFG